MGLSRPRTSLLERQWQAPRLRMPKRGMFRRTTPVPAPLVTGWPPLSELRENESRARAERERARQTEQESADEERVRKGFGTKAGSGRPHRTRIALSPA